MSVSRGEIDRPVILTVAAVAATAAILLILDRRSSRRLAQIERQIVDDQQPDQADYVRRYLRGVEKRARRSGPPLRPVN